MFDLTETRMPSPGSTNRDVALDLVRRGFLIFPICDWGDGDGWKPIKDFKTRATCSESTVRLWWTNWPDARVGLLGGQRNKITVLDLDRKNGKDGIAALAALGFPDPEALSPVLTRTPSGGWHVFFAYEPRLKNSVSRIGSGIDVKTEGGYVIAPGSLKDGVRYQVVGAPLGTVELPAFPEALIPPPPPHDFEPAAIVTQPSDEQRVWASEHLAKLCETLARTGEGERHDRLNSAAMWAGGAAAHGFVDQEQAEVALLAAAKLCGLPDREAHTTFVSGWHGGLKRPIANFPRDWGADVFDDLDSTDVNRASGVFDGMQPLAANDWDVFGEAE